MFFETQCSGILAISGAIAKIPRETHMRHVCDIIYDLYIYHNMRHVQSIC